jgi:hypothetical protein
MALTFIIVPYIMAEVMLLTGRRCPDGAVLSVAVRSIAAVRALPPLSREHNSQCRLGTRKRSDVIAALFRNVGEFYGKKDIFKNDGCRNGRCADW